MSDEELQKRTGEEQPSLPENQIQPEAITDDSTNPILAIDQIIARIQAMPASTETSSTQAPIDQYQATLEFVRVVLELPVIALGLIATIEPMVNQALQQYWYLTPLGITLMALMYQEMKFGREVKADSNVVDGLIERIKEKFHGSQEK
jgi:hypothetical protein